MCCAVFPATLSNCDQATAGNETATAGGDEDEEEGEYDDDVQEVTAKTSEDSKGTTVYFSS